MILLSKPNHGCIYKIDTDTQELCYAPIYNNQTVNLNEFAPIDLSFDDEVEIQQIEQMLIHLFK